MVTWTASKNRACLVAGRRTPFVKAGDALRHVHVTELAAHAMRQTLDHASWPADQLDEVVLGNVVMPADAANPARVAALYAGVPEQVPALTVQRNCASGMEAIAHAASHIEHGEVRAMLAGGAESMSTIPLIFPQSALGAMARLSKAKSVWGKARAVCALRPKHFKPIAGLKLGLTDPTCGMIMGETAEVLAHTFGISREEQDAFALHSHEKAVAAAVRLGEQIATYYVGERFTPVSSDIGPRENQSLEALARLRPFFDRRDGTVTVGNACQVTDGAAMLLVADHAAAEAYGLDAVAYVRGYATAAVDPTRMGLGPVHAISRLLHATGVPLDSIGLFEINEAFAVVTLAAEQQLSIPHDKVNVNGGAVALGHPIGASGARILTTLLHALQARKMKYDLAAICIGGGEASTVIVEMM